MKCAYCKNEFTPTRKDNIYCCLNCGKKAYRKREREKERKNENIYSPFEGLEWDKKRAEFKKLFSRSKPMCPKTHCVWAKNGYCVQPNCFEVMI